MTNSYIMLDAFDKRLYRVHKIILDNSTDQHILTMAKGLNHYDGHLPLKALRVAVAGAVRTRKLVVR